MASKEFPPHAEHLRRSVVSVSTCSSDSVEALSSILLSGSVEAVQNAKLGISSKEQSVGATLECGTRKPRVRRTRKNEVIILDIEDNGPAPLQPVQRLYLATEVVNGSLKTLTEVLKTSTIQELRQKSKPSNRTSSGCLSRDSPSATSPKPLRPRNVNQLSSTPRAGSCLRRPSTASINTSAYSAGLIAIAECARVAFAALRQLERQNDKELVITNLQLETGMSALIGKLIALGLDDLAVKELKILKNRLSSVGNCLGKVAKGRTIVHAKQTLTDLLHFEDIPTNPQILSLVLATQLHILKLIATKKRGSSVEEILEHVIQPAHSAPISLFDTLLKSEMPQAREKSVRQLEVFSKVVLSLCPGLSVSDDEHVVNNRKFASPCTIFRLQMLALNMRQMRWEVLNHKLNLKEELLDPFLIFLRVFVRRTTSKDGKNFEVAKLAIEKLSGTLLEHMDNSQVSRSTHDELGFEAYKALSEMARKCQRFTDAIQCLDHATTHLSTGNISQARKASAACQSAMLYLKVNGSTEGLIRDKTISAVRTAISALRGNCSDDLFARDELFLDSAGLCRSALAVLFSKTGLSEESVFQKRDTIELGCFEIVLLTSKCLVRYLDDILQAMVSNQSTARPENRLAISFHVTRSTIEAVAALAKHPFADDFGRWNEVDTALQDCVQSILSYNHNKESGPHNTRADWSLLLMTLSDAYWFHYLRQNRSHAPLVEMRRTLEASIDILKDSTVLEQSKAFIPVKLERLAGLYEDSDDIAKSAATYAAALRIQIAAGCLLEAIKTAATEPWSHVSEHSGLSIVKRLLAGVIRSTSTQSSIALYDDEALADDERGILLESQMALLEQTMHRRTATARTSNALRKISNTLLAIYTRQHYPVRRLRVCVNILRVQSFNAEVFDSTFIEKALDLGGVVITNVHHNDVGLLRFEPHLLACSHTYKALSLGSPDMDILQSCIGTWSELMSHCFDQNALKDQVHDVPLWLRQLETVVEYLNMHGYGVLCISVLRLMVSVRELQFSALDLNATPELVSLGLQLVRLGHSGKAGEAFQKARNCLDRSTPQRQTALRWQLAYSEYLFEIGNTDRGRQCLREAQDMLVTLQASAGDGACDFNERCDLMCRNAELSHLLSEQALLCKSIPEALLHARQSVRITYHLWAVMDHKMRNTKVKTSPLQAEEASLMIDAMTTMSLSKPPTISALSTTYQSLKTVHFWPLVSELHRRLMNLSRVFAHQGMYPEAQYYAEQAVKVANAVEAAPLRAQAKSLIAAFSTHRGLPNDVLKEMKSSSDTGHHDVQVQLALAQAFGATSNFVSQDQTLRSVEAQVVESMSTAVFVELDHRLMKEKIKTQDQKTSSKPSLMDRSSKKLQSANAKYNAKIAPKVKVPGPVILPQVTEFLPLLRLRAVILRDLARCAMRSKNLSLAESYLLEARSLPANQNDSIIQTLVSAQLLLRQGLAITSTDPVLSVLPDSTISCPATALGGSRRSKDHLSTSTCLEESTQARNLNLKALSKNRGRSPGSKGSQLEGRLQQALANFNDIHCIAQLTSTSMVLHQISATFVKIVVLLSAACPTLSQRRGNSMLGAYALELGRSAAALRESSTVQIERLITAQNNATSVGVDTDCDLLRVSNIGLRSFQQEFIDIIPESWTVITISLSDHRDQLWISKMRAGQVPFIIAIPLGRHSTEDNDDGAFGFDQGKAEILKIIDLANCSTHNAQDMSAKGARKAWWEARTALDARLKDFLENLENIWLGGFRGIFSRHRPQQDLLSRFDQSFSNILNKYLPSRRKFGKESSSTRVSFDTRVLELFVDLGDPNEVNDLEEPLTDLLYFVVDILQFNGERNAYDEIDFDSIIIETLDALTQYHTAADKGGESTCAHTILVLDKALHCFPWESLPCMSGQAVSRLPSLCHLRSRILRQRQQTTIHACNENGYCINLTDGAFILNPGGDLSATQAKFQKPLEALPGWSGIISRTPSEDEMSLSLSTRSLYLYFGHGSGGHFIRSKTVKNLEKCAIALLMGCSSAALKEEGEFESHGNLLNYLQAGAQAVVGTLWDVTDKDIDRFSMAALEQWGLFRDSAVHDDQNPLKKRTSTRRKRVKDELGEDSSSNDGIRPSSLDQAIAQSRKACILRYLNGAAPVVYGTPVFLA
ncbi:hypothetical protein MMC19_003202 [Ptychographa xylographoides]|nr:hypothetical protein [Ptychographa xylographoides]